MQPKKRNRTNYPGVYWIDSVAVGSQKPAGGSLLLTPGHPEKIFYIKYRRDGRTIEEKAGRQFQDKMTPAKAAAMRVQRIRGDDLSNREKRRIQEEEAERLRDIPAQRWTLAKLFDEYQVRKSHLKGLPQDRSYFKHLQDLADREPHEITPAEVDQVKREILNKKSPQTCKLVLALLRRVSRWGFSMRFSKPLSFPLELPRVNNLVTEFLTPPKYENSFRL